MADNVQFPIEAGHVMLFRRAVGYPDADTSSAVPPTFVIASAQFDPDYPLRPKPGEPWSGSGKNPTGAAPSDDSDDDGSLRGRCMPNSTSSTTGRSGSARR